jgi:hypothetical protein
LAENAALRLFVSYATEDEDYRRQFEQALAGMRRAGLVETWTFREIAPGEDLDHAISSSLDRADIVALFVSPAFLDSDYCWDVEMKHAVERHDRGQAVLVPIVIRSCVWEDTPFARLNALPTDAKPVAEWASRDQAWTSVARGIRTVIERVNDGSAPPRQILTAAKSGLLGRDAEGFLTAEAVLHLVLSRVQGRQRPLEQPILLFENSFQRTWLVITERVIGCVLDDIAKNKLYDPLRWECRHRFALPVEVEAYKRKTGLLHLGPEHRDWLYSTHLHPDPRRLKAELEFLLKGADV